MKFPQNRGRTTKKEKGSLQIREVCLQSLNQHSGEVKLEVDEALKDLDVFKSPLERKKKEKAEWESVKSITRINIHRFSREEVS